MLKKFLTIAAMMCSIASLAQVERSPKLVGLKNKSFPDVVYASKSPAQKLDIYLPDGNGPFPVIIHIHGGAFWGGDKVDGQINPVLEALKKGYAVVSTNYRLSTEAVFPAQLQDVKAAIRFLRANEKKYNLSTSRIAVWGDSAGGHLAAMAGTTSDVKEFDDASLGNIDKSSAVQAVIDWFGPIWFDKMGSQFKVSGKGSPNFHEIDSAMSTLIGKNIFEAPDLVKRASPATWLSKSDPPMLIQHGTEDPLVPVVQSENFYSEAMKVMGKENCKLTILHGAGHGGQQFENEKNLELVFEFIKKSFN